MKIINRLLATVFFLLLFIFSACGAPTTQKYEKEKFLFGTYIKMIIYSESEKKAELAFENAFKEIERVDNLYNSKNVNSIIYNLNSQKSDIKKVNLDKEGVEIFKKVNEVYNISKGRFDITIGPLMEVWGFADEMNPGKIPNSKELEKAKNSVGYERVTLTEDEIILNSPTKSLDTGSFLKGYAIEKGKEKLIESGIKHGFISAVSSICTIGKKPDGTNWKIGIQNPNSSNEILGIVELNGESVGVSGDYQTFVEIDGKKYHHILDKETGYPVRDKKMVVVIGKNGAQEDLLSTALFLMKEDEIKKFIAENKELKIFIVRADMSTYMSENFTLLK